MTHPSSSVLLFSILTGSRCLAILEPMNLPLKPSTSKPVVPPAAAVNCSVQNLRRYNPDGLLPLSKMPVNRRDLQLSDSSLGSGQPARADVGEHALVPSNLDKPINCSDSEVSIQPLSDFEERWKNTVVMGCTVAVALEVLIVLLMILFWQQIRWTLRKLTCPCDYIRERAARSRHRAMRARAANNNNIDTDNDEEQPNTDRRATTTVESLSSLDSAVLGDSTPRGQNTTVRLYDLDPQSSDNDLERASELSGYHTSTGADVPRILWFDETPFNLDTGKGVDLTRGLYQPIRRRGSEDVPRHGSRGEGYAECYYNEACGVRTDLEHGCDYKLDRSDEPHASCSYDADFFAIVSDRRRALMTYCAPHDEGAKGREGVGTCLALSVLNSTGTSADAVGSCCTGDMRERQTDDDDGVVVYEGKGKSPARRV